MAIQKYVNHHHHHHSSLLFIILDDIPVGTLLSRVKSKKCKKNKAGMNIGWEDTVVFIIIIIHTFTHLEDTDDAGVSL